MEASNRTALNWINLANAEGSRFNRRHVLRWWLAANGFWNAPLPDKWGPKEGKNRFWSDLLATADDVVGRVRSGQVDAYDSVNRLIDHLRLNHKASSTILAARGQILKFFRYYRLGLNPDDVEESIKKIRRFRVLATKLPSREQVRGLMLVSPLKTKVLISTLVSTGGRAGEVLNVRRADLDLTRKPAVVYFRKSKSDRGRFSFLSSETVGLIKHYLGIRGRELEYLFDSMDGRRVRAQRRLDEPLSKTAAWARIRKSCHIMGMDERYDGFHFYSKPRMFRVLNLAILKSGGYPPDWAEYLVGHNLGTQASYIPPMETLAKEWSKLDYLFCFLQEPSRLEQTTVPFALPGLGIDIAPQPSPVQRLPSAIAREATGYLEISAHRWGSRAWLYVKTSILSADYDQALADGYTIFDRDERGLRILRKRRQPIGNNPS